ncbi:DUF523 domain-containing protein [Hydrogenibacillus sp. N12]|uniref:DUF523 domain-containing protein n=1 Tax=Hydrogenibacillus sp. N12 TaxID=2866627 RepID=UPI001C7D0E04|nr:DUF523 domain-containing protein [Hydrogenibacillus sp. N12]QZA32800.1 DUF523 domain-containing protein [Hydrogenibacillus sp. N12]
MAASRGGSGRRAILVSACLLGHPVTYTGDDNFVDDPRLRRWLAEGRVIAVCPEVAGGLSTPRPPAEIRGDRVVTVDGRDVTEAFQKGAEAALALARHFDVALALLKQSSPSCGSRRIYDGTFSGRKIPGEGVTARRLREAGIPVFGEDELDRAEAALRAAEGPSANGPSDAEPEAPRRG